MKFMTFQRGNQTAVGAMLDNNEVLDLTSAWDVEGVARSQAPTNVGDLVQMGEAGLAAVQALLERAHVSSHRIAASELRYCAPIPFPRKNIFCVGRNYREHIIEGNLARGRDPNDFPKAVEFFTKAPTAVTGHRQPVRRHAHVTDFLDYEAELGIVIGKTGFNISRECALEHVFGYTIINDITARDLQVQHGQWFKGKSLDTTCPVGPVVVHCSAIQNPQALDIELEVNGELRQKANTSSMLFTVADILHQLSAGMTLEAGDLIATGTPAGVGIGLSPPKPLQVGDLIRARISGIGELENRIAD